MNISVHTKKLQALAFYLQFQMLFLVLMRKPLMHTHKSHSPFLHLSPVWFTHSGCPLEKEAVLLQGLRVKGRLWLHARLITGNIEIWLSSGIDIFSVLVSCAIDGI